MLLRLSFLVALILGLGDLFGWIVFSRPILVVHIVAGLVVLLSIWILAALQHREGQASAGTWTAPFLALLGASLGLWFPASGSEAIGILHLVVMLLAVGLVEMRTARRRNPDRR